MSDEVRCGRNTETDGFRNGAFLPAIIFTTLHLSMGKLWGARLPDRQTDRHAFLSADRKGGREEEDCKPT